MNFMVPIAYAADSLGAVQKLLNPIIDNIVAPVIEFMFALAVVVFAYGIFQMIWGGESEEARTNGKRSMLGGVIGMTIMLSAWGIIYFVANTVKGF